MLTSYYIIMDPAYSDMPAASIGRSPTGAMLGTPYQTKLTFLANLLTFLRILLQWKLDYDKGAFALLRPTGRSQVRVGASRRFILFPTPHHPSRFLRAKCFLPINQWPIL